MVLEVHHLRLSQSDRILWTLEEMQLPYELVIYERELKTALAPQTLKDITPVGTAPYFRDTSVSPPIALFESGAIVQYLVDVYGPTAKGTKLVRQPGEAGYADHLQFFHFANTSVQGLIGRTFSMAAAGMKGTPMYDRLSTKLEGQLKILDQQLSKHRYLADDELSIADIMTVFSLTTMRGFFPINLTPYPNILRYVEDVTSRPAYIEALRKGDNGMEPLKEPNARRFTQFEAFKTFLEGQ